MPHQGQRFNIGQKKAGSLVLQKLGHHLLFQGEWAYKFKQTHQSHVESNLEGVHE